MADPPFRRLFDHRSEALADRVQQHHAALIPPPVQRALDATDAFQCARGEPPPPSESALESMYRRAATADNLDQFRAWLWSGATMTQLMGLHVRLSALYTQILDTAPGDPWHDQVAAALAQRADALGCATIVLESF